MTRHRESSDSRSFGRTGPAEVRSCGCDVLPWEDCEHSAWDADKSLERVLQESIDFHLAAPVNQAATAPAPLSIEVLALLERCRKLAHTVVAMDVKRANLARIVITDIDAVTQGRRPV